MSLPAVDDPRAVLRDLVPLIDVRAPVEFAQGAPATAVNLPLLGNVERAAVGTCYRAHGHDAAYALGERLVAGSRRAARIRSWVDRLEREPASLVTCWRGGDRSAVTQQWLLEATGRAVPRVAGGFKALRRAAMDASADAAESRGWLVVGGRTGSGKTDLLQRFGSRALDLEAHANHRGSAFGALPGGQPTQVRFEFDVAVDLLRTRLPTGMPMLIEDESPMVGSVSVPRPLVEVIRSAPLVWVEIEMERRIENVFGDYVAGPLRAGADPHELAASLLGATERIRKRLGGDQHHEAAAEIRAAFRAKDLFDSDAHAPWIRRLLERYYDPFYDRQLAKQRDRVCFRGDFDAVCAFLRDSESAESLRAGPVQGRSG